VRSISFDAAADYYDATRSLPPEPMARTTEALARRLGGGRALEIGAGTGRFTVPLQRAGVDLLPVDVSPRMLAVGVSKGMRAPLLADATHLPFQRAAFDNAPSVGVLHLVPDWAGAVLDIARVIRRDFMTVLQRSGGFNPERAYLEALHEQGVPETRVGLAEVGIAERFPPRESEETGSWSERADLDIVLERLRQRILSVQWGVPEDAHRRAVEMVSERYRGRTLHMAHELEVAAWDATELAASVHSGTL